MTNIQHKRLPQKLASLPHLRKKSLNQGFRKQQLVKITMENHVSTAQPDAAQTATRPGPHPEHGQSASRGQGP